MEDDTTGETDFLVQSHITGKFPISGEKIDPLEYFNEFTRELEEFAAETKDLYPHKPGVSTNSALLSYHGEPQPFLFEPNKYFRHYIVACKKLNRQLALNEDLATVRWRKSGFSWKAVYPKYALYLFKAREHSIVREPAKKIIFQIKIYKPYSANGRQEDIKIQQELWMKGTQTLKKLRDALVCHLDYCGLDDVSHQHPSSWQTELPTYKANQEKFPSCFFFINRTFYATNDSGVVKVREFLEHHHFGDFTTETINTKLEAIPVEIGRPYVYQHLGQCEHVFVFSDVRLMTNDDPCKIKPRPGRFWYPFLNAISNSFAKQCMLCNLAYAHWLVTNFAKLMLSRAFLCHRCFLSYCYIDNRKAGDFQAYQYFDPTSFL